MQNFNRALTALTAGVALSVAANVVVAQGKAVSQDRYNFIEGRFVVDAEVDGVNDDADGFRFGGSYRLNKQIYAIGEWETVEFDDSDADLDFLRVGAGYIHPLNPQFDINAEVHLIRAELDWGEDDDSETGYALAGGVRGKATPEIEVRGMFILEDIEDRDTYITLGADYFFQPNLSAGIEMDLAADYETFSIGARFHF